MACDCGNMPLHYDARAALRRIIDDEDTFWPAWDGFATKYPTFDEWVLGVRHWIKAVDDHVGVANGGMWVCPSLPGEWMNPSMPLASYLLAGLRLTVAGLNKDEDQLQALLAVVTRDHARYVFAAVLHTTSSILIGELTLTAFFPGQEVP